MISGKPRSEAERIRELNELSKQNFEEQSYMNANVTYKLVDINEIRFHYDVIKIYLAILNLLHFNYFIFKDSIIKLNTILSNSIKPKLKEEAQELMNKLNEIMFVSKIWLECQIKVKNFICFQNFLKFFN